MQRLLKKILGKILLGIYAVLLAPLLLALIILNIVTASLGQGWKYSLGNIIAMIYGNDKRVIIFLWELLNGMEYL